MKEELKILTFMFVGIIVFGFSVYVVSGVMSSSSAISKCESLEPYGFYTKLDQSVFYATCKVQLENGNYVSAYSVDVTSMIQNTVRLKQKGGGVR